MSMKDKIKFILLELKDTIKQLLFFFMWLPGYYKLHKNYGYKPDTYDFIIDNYEKVLCCRTRIMSKPTYNWYDVVTEIDRYFEDRLKEDWNLEDDLK